MRKGQKERRGTKEERGGGSKKKKRKRWRKNKKEKEKGRKEGRMRGIIKLKGISETFKPNHQCSMSDKNYPTFD